MKLLLKFCIFFCIILFFTCFVFAVPLIDFVPPTFPNATITTNTSIEINVSIIESNLNSLIYNWNGTNFTLYDGSLVAMYNFDNISDIGENSTYIVDISRNANNGTVALNALWNSSGKYNGAYQFVGSNYILIPNQNYLKPPVYVSAWVKTNTNGGNIFQKYGGAGYSWDGWSLSLNGSNNPGIWTNAQSIDQFIWGNQSLINGWNQIYAEVRVNGREIIYLNGQLILNGSDSDSNYNEQVALTIGNGLDGSIDEVRVWNRSLSANEIYENYISNLQKFNSTQWYLYVNQTKNITSPLENGTYTYQVFATNSSGSLNFSEVRYIIVGNNTVSETSPPNDSRILLDWIYPTVSINVNQNEFFNISVNVSCSISDCGEINVTLDPAGDIYNFTSCGKAGSAGPSQANCDLSYNGTTLQGLVTVSSGIQTWIVPTTGFYRITLAGAGGGSGNGNPGDGIIIQETFNLIAGQELKILVGQNGSFVSGSWSGAGGGGTFIVNSDNAPLFVAGGGSGACNGFTGQNGQNITSGGGISPGVNGSGGGTGNGGGGGGGLLTNGANGNYGPGGSSFLNLGVAGTNGGFGGGGGQTNSGQNIAGGGGGYSGGSGNTESTQNAGGGGFI